MVMEEVASSSSSFPLIPLLSPPCILGFLRGKTLALGPKMEERGLMVSVRERKNERK